MKFKQGFSTAGELFSAFCYDFTPDDSGHAWFEVFYLQDSAPVFVPSGAEKKQIKHSPYSKLGQ
jgi:hypothetical protein